MMNEPKDFVHNGPRPSPANSVRQDASLQTWMNERPWLVLGTAIATGYIVGRMSEQNKPSTTMFAMPRMHGPFPSTADFTYEALKAQRAPSAEQVQPDQPKQDQPKQPAQQRYAQPRFSASARISQELNDELSLWKTAALSAAHNWIRSLTREVAAALQLESPVSQQSRAPSPGTPPVSVPVNPFV